jgi:hypothetical protein
MQKISKWEAKDIELLVSQYAEHGVNIPELAEKYTQKEMRAVVHKYGLKTEKEHILDKIWAGRTLLPEEREKAAQWKFIARRPGL